MISSKRPIVVYIEQARIPDETTSITRSEVPITGDIVVHHRIQNGANNKAMGDGFLKELYDVLNGAVGENLRFEDGASVFVYTSCARSIENYENFERNIRFGSDLPVHSFRACQKIPECSALQASPHFTGNGNASWLYFGQRPGICRYDSE